MNSIKTIFFGSTSDSVIVLNKLCQVSGVTLQAIVTQPAKPVGRDQVMTHTPVEIWAKDHNIPVLTFPSNQEKSWLYENESEVIESLSTFQADLIISACYGERIPIQVIQATKFGGINVHPSLLPRWRGGDPVPWAILAGDHQTGATIVTLQGSFDTGEIIDQVKIPITDHDFPDTLRSSLFTKGATLLADVLPMYIADQKNNKTSRYHVLKQDNMKQHPVARRLTRSDGYIPFELIQRALQKVDAPTIQSNEAGSRHTKPDPAPLDNITIIKVALEQSEEKQIHLPMLIQRAFRAFSPWPGIWTTIEIKGDQKRLKILDVSIDPSAQTLKIKTVQLEGKSPVSWEQFTTAYLIADS
ncbi:methionyl-tRNA formyltransferase [Candidatus Gottesmanbacteria bacterium]|nr:methionyl-tRNA formyltransferase [Candidatus Gottesmanbacteria bacterium]